LVAKTVRDAGATARRFVERMRQTVAELERKEGDLGAIGRRLADAVDAYQQAVEFIVGRSKDDLRAVYAGAVPYLKLAGIVHGGWHMARAAIAASARLADDDEPELLRAKVITARYFADHVLVSAGSLADTVTAGATATLALTDEQF
jgi:3-(methylthio)propanoyl-CoA dehydrogenase